MRVPTTGLRLLFSLFFWIPWDGFCTYFAAFGGWGVTRLDEWAWLRSQVVDLEAKDGEPMGFNDCG